MPGVIVLPAFVGAQQAKNHLHNTFHQARLSFHHPPLSIDRKNNFPLGLHRGSIILPLRAARAR